MSFPRPVFYLHRSVQFDLSPVHQVQEVPLQDLPHDRVLGQAMPELLALPVCEAPDLGETKKVMTGLPFTYILLVTGLKKFKKLFLFIRVILVFL